MTVIELEALSQLNRDSFYHRHVTAQSLGDFKANSGLYAEVPPPLSNPEDAPQIYKVEAEPLYGEIVKLTISYTKAKAAKWTEGEQAVALLRIDPRQGTYEIIDGEAALVKQCFRLQLV